MTGWLDEDFDYFDRTDSYSEDDPVEAKFFVAALGIFYAASQEIPRHGTNFKPIRKGNAELSIGRREFTNYKRVFGGSRNLKTPKAPEEYMAEFNELIRDQRDGRVDFEDMGTFNVMIFKDLERDISITAATISGASLGINPYHSVHRGRLSITVKGVEVSNFIVERAVRDRTPIMEDFEIELSRKYKHISVEQEGVIKEKIIIPLATEARKFSEPPKSQEELEAEAAAKELLATESERAKEEKEAINNALSSL